MLWVTISDRIVRKTSRPINTGRQTLTNVSSPTNARSPTQSVAHGSRCPPPPNLIARPAQIPAPRNARRQRSSRSAPNWESSPIATTSSQTTVPRGPICTPSSTTIRGATRRVSAPRSTPSPIWAPCSRSAAIFSSEERDRNASGSARTDSRYTASITPTLSSRSNEAGNVTPSVETPARAGRRSRASRTPSVARSAPRRPSR